MRRFSHDHDPQGLSLIPRTIDEGEEASIDELWNDMIDHPGSIKPGELIFDIQVLMWHFYCSLSHDGLARKWLPRLLQIYQDKLAAGAMERWMVVDGWAIARLAGEVALSDQILAHLREAYQQGTQAWWKYDWVAWGLLHMDEEAGPLKEAETRIRQAEDAREGGQDVIRSSRTMLEIVKAIRDRDQDAFDAAWQARGAFWAEEAEDNDPESPEFLCDVVGAALGDLAEARGLTVEPDAYRDLEWWREIRDGA